MKCKKLSRNNAGSYNESARKSLLPSEFEMTFINNEIGEK
jgi:hypothetical protein